MPKAFAEGNNFAIGFNTLTASITKMKAAPTLTLLAIGLTYEGPILQLTLEEVITVPEVVYTEEPDKAGLEKDYIILPSEGNELVVMWARVDNHDFATRVHLDIDIQPAELRMDTGRYYAVNTHDVKEACRRVLCRQECLPTCLSFEGLRSWKRALNCAGWIVFEVPKGVRRRVPQVGSGRKYNNYRPLIPAP